MIFCLVGFWDIGRSREKIDQSIENAQKELNEFTIQELKRFKK